jgi:hypothetical protein
MNTTTSNLDSDLAYVYRNLGVNIGSDEDILAWLRTDFANEREVAVLRGYASAAALDGMAEEYATRIHPVEGAESPSPLVRGLRLWSALRAVVGDYEADDVNLDGKD